MGYDNKCIGLSIYLGDKGYEDLCSITTKPIDDTVTTYMMYDQTCLTFYMGDREEVVIIEQRSSYPLSPK